jgi:hypothetical protein
MHHKLFAIGHKPVIIRVLILGDIVAKIGRVTAIAALAQWKREYSPDLIIGNIENLTHGKGVTEKTLHEMREAGLMIGTGGNHVWSKEDPNLESVATALPLALPANDSRAGTLGKFQEITVGQAKIIVLNLLGQAGMHDETTENPFLYFDRFYEEAGRPKHVIVDLHTELTSEKVAFGFHVAGRASLVYGTHTHVPTADARILSGGTGYITDLGMTGSDDSVLGVAKEVIIKRFLGAEKLAFDYPETGPAQANGLYAELDTDTGRCSAIRQLQFKTTI